jgi:hypothetical protein
VQAKIKRTLGAGIDADLAYKPSAVNYWRYRTGGERAAQAVSSRIYSQCAAC